MKINANTNATIINTTNTANTNANVTNTNNNVRYCRFCFVVRATIESYEYVPLCENCARNVPRCMECGRHILFSYNRIEDRYGNHLCLECAMVYRRCPVCNRFYHKRFAVFDGEEYVCPECGVTFEAAIEEEHIKRYSYKPQPKHYGHFQKDLLLGVELEVDHGGEDNKKARKLLEIVNGKEEEKFVYIKHDGSLSNGFEIVSHPATLQHHLNTIPWEKAFKFLKENGYESDNTSTCGLHVHINRLFLGKTYKSIVNVEARILFFVEHFWNYLVKFSRRTQYELDRWCARYGHTDYDLAIQENMESRYHALNFQNRATIEFRFFKGTLDYSTFVATLRLVFHIVMYCKKFGTKKIKQRGWNGFLNFIVEDSISENVSLAKYMLDLGIWQ